MSWVVGQVCTAMDLAHLAVGTQNRKVARSSCRCLGCLELPRALPLHSQSNHLPCQERTIGARQRGAAWRRAQLSHHSTAAIPPAQVFTPLCKPIDATGSAGVALLTLDLGEPRQKRDTARVSVELLMLGQLRIGAAAGGAQSPAWRAASPAKASPSPPNALQIAWERHHDGGTEGIRASSAGVDGGRPCRRCAPRPPGAAGPRCADAGRVGCCGSLA